MKLRVLLVFIVLMAANISHAHDRQVRHVILISFDGLRPDAITALGPQKAPIFNQLIEQGAATLNARSDYDYTVTIPNHTTMITGYPVMGPKGHHVTDNTIVDKMTHDYADRHVYSIFDVLHEHKRTSAMLASKLKFNIYSRSYPIDTVALTDQDDLKTLDTFEKLSHDGLPDFVFIHFSNPDHVGHQKGWDITPGDAYMNAVEVLDGYLGRVVDVINRDPTLKDSTILIITTDHGGEGKGHSDATNPRNYMIPLIIWGKAVAKGVDLYTINIDRRKNPSDQRIGNRQNLQPIRNGDAANLALSLLGLPAVDGSTIGHDKPLKINKD